MKIRIFNAKILTMEDENILNGEVWIQDDVISYVGEKRIIECNFDMEIDANQNLIMPGLKNAHAHSAMTFARSYADGYPLDRWLNEKIFPMEAKLTKENINIFSQLAYLEYMSSGITANFDMYYEPDAISEASRNAGMRTVLCGAINNFKESVEILEGYYLKYNTPKDLVSYILGFHAEYTTSLEIMKEIGLLANKFKAPVFVHNAETALEVNACKERYGTTPTQVFDSCGMFNHGGGGFHGIYLEDADIKIFKEKGLYLITNPCSNLKLASGICPVSKYLREGINMAIGTDGASSNNALDMFREMYLVSTLQKVIEKDPLAISAFEVLKMATVNGARAMGLENCTTLSEGKKADLIMINLHMPNMEPENNIINNLVYSGGKSNVVLTMIDGKIVYRDGEYFTIDEEKIYYEANQMMKALTA